MAKIRIKRAASLPGTSTLLGGELAIAGTKLYYGQYQATDSNPTEGIPIAVLATAHNEYSNNNTFKVANASGFAVANTAGDIKYFANTDGYLRTSISNSLLTGTMLVNADYVDAAIQGLKIRDSVKVVSSASLIFTDDTLFNTSIAGTTGLDGSIALVDDDRVLIKVQTTTAEKYNGIYTVSLLGGIIYLSRAADMDASAEFISAFTFVEEGTLADTGWVCTVDDGFVMNTDDVTWSQFSGAGSYTAGVGLTRTGTEFSITTLTADRALITNGSGELAVSAVTSTELGYLDGVTSAIQTQIGNKLSSNVADTALGLITMNAGMDIGPGVQEAVQASQLLTFKGIGVLAADFHKDLYMNNLQRLI